MLNKLVLALVAVMALAVPVLAHQSMSLEPGYVNYDGRMKLRITNLYPKQASFQLQVVDRVDEKDIDEKQWRSDALNDLVILQPNESRDVLIEVRNPGKYYVCNQAINEGDSIQTRICHRLHYR